MSTELVSQGGSKMINSVYMGIDTITQLKSQYNSDSEFETVSLSQFLELDYLEEISKELSGLSFRRTNRPIMYRKMIANVPTILQDLYTSSGFKELFEEITGEVLNISSEELVQFGHTDYQILHDELLPPPGIDLILDLTEEWDDEQGGFITYTDGDGDFSTLTQRRGTLSIVNRNSTHHRFVKYVNHHAENSSRCYLILTIIFET